jgi:hypothetical protein
MAQRMKKTGPPSQEMPQEKQVRFAPFSSRIFFGALRAFLEKKIPRRYRRTIHGGPPNPFSTKIICGAWKNVNK